MGFFLLCNGKVPISHHHRIFPTMSLMLTLQEIVETRLTQLKLGAVEAAVMAGIERTYIRDIVEGRKKSVRTDKIHALAAALKLDPAALARNELVPIPFESKKSLVSSFDPDHEDDLQDDSTEVGFHVETWNPLIAGALPEIDVKLGAGEGTVGGIVSLRIGDGTIAAHPVIAEWSMPLSFLRDEAKAKPSQTIVMEVVGDSMFPNYMPGDRVLVDLSQNRLVSDTVYAISDGNNEPQIKRLQKVPFSDPVQVRIISDNTTLETFTVELEKLTIVGRICGHIARK